MKSIKKFLRRLLILIAIPLALVATICLIPFFILFGIVATYIPYKIIIDGEIENANYLTYLMLKFIKKNGMYDNAVIKAVREVRNERLKSDESKNI